MPITKIQLGQAVGVGREDSELGGERVQWKGWIALSSFSAECHTTSPRKLSLLLQVESLLPALGSWKHCAALVMLDWSPRAQT